MKKKLSKQELALKKIAAALQAYVNDHIANIENPHGVTKTLIGLSNVTNDAQVKRSEMGANNGVATLGSNGKVISSQLPSYTLDDVLDGTNRKIPTKVSQLTNDSGFLTSHQSLTDYATKTFVENKFKDAFGIDASSVSDLAAILSDNDYTTGILNVIAGKVDKVSGKGLSTNDYTTAEKNKLSGIETGAQVHKAPTATEVKSALGTGSGTSKYLREDGTWVTPPNDNTTYNEATTSVAGLMSAADKTKLNGIAAGATANIGTITGIKMNGVSKGTSGVIDLGTVITSHQDISGKSDKSATVSTITYDATNKKFTKTINGTTTDVVTIATIKTDLAFTKSDLGLGNVGDFKAVSTVASLGLTSTELANARANIGAGTSSLTLGNNSSNAYYGDKGKIAYDHSQATHARTDATKVEASSTNGNIKINGTETTVYLLPTSDPYSSARTPSSHTHGNITNDGKITSTVVTAATGVLVYDSSNKIQRATAAQLRSIIGAGTSSFSGSYNDLTNKPTLFSGSYTDLTNKPTLFSGSYNDLTNKPTIPAAANNGTFSIKTKVGTANAVTAADFTANQSTADDITLIQGTNITLTTDATNRTITITAIDTTYSAATTSVAGLMSATDKSKLDGIASGATANTGTITGIKMNGASKGTSGVVDLGTVITAHQDISGKVNTSTTVNGHALTGNVTVTKSDVGLSNVTNDSLVKRSEMGAVSGVATLDSSGKVPSSQLPSYVDDVIEAYYKVADGKFYTTLSNGTYSGAITGETGKIYVDLSTSRTYRWGGSAYAEIKASPGTLDDITDGSTYVRMTSTERTKLSGIATGATANTGTITKVGNTSSGAVTVSSSNKTASFGNAVTVGSVGGVDLKFTMPGNPNTNTWRPIQVGGTDKLTDSSTKLNFAGSGATSISYSNGTITISSTDNNTVTSINNKTGAIAAADIATVLTGAGYKLTDTNTHYTAVPVLGGSTATSNATSAVTDPYLNIIENSAKSGGIRIKGSGATSVSAVNGVITINSTDTNTQAVSSVVGQTGAVTAAQIGTALTNAGYKLTDTNTWRPVGTGATDAAAGNHTHTTSLATDTGTSTVTLASAGKYKLTAGGTSVIFTMPTIPTVSYPVTSVNNKTGAVSLTASDVGAATSGHTHTTSIATSTGTNQLTLTANTKYAITAGGTTYVFTTPPDTNTWRGIQNNLTSDSTTDSLSAAQGKALKGLIDGKAASGHTHGISIATDSGTNLITLAYGTKYKLTAGGLSYIFTMPASDNTNLITSVVGLTGAVTAALIASALTSAGYKLTDTNTWRTVQCNGTSIGNNTLNLKSGTNITLSNSNGEITIAASSTTYSEATTSTAGLMSALDKTRLDLLYSELSGIELLLATI